jgi:hypothetical protein
MSGKGKDRKLRPIESFENLFFLSFPHFPGGNPRRIKTWMPDRDTRA